MDSRLTSTWRVILFITALPFHPIRWPTVLIEMIVNRWSSDWVFGPFSATPYFLLISGLSAYAVVYWGFWYRVAGLYFLTAMEFLALWNCLAIATGNRGGVFQQLKQYTWRSHREISKQPIFGVRSLYMGIVSYGFTVFYFGIANLFVYRLDAKAFCGLNSTLPLGTAWEFLYYSVVTITTLGYGDISPKKFWSQALTVAEVALGLFFVLFLFGAFVSFHVNQLSNQRHLNNDASE